MPSKKQQKKAAKRKHSNNADKAQKRASYLELASAIIRFLAEIIPYLFSHK